MGSLGGDSAPAGWAAGSALQGPQGSVADLPLELFPEVVGTQLGQVGSGCCSAGHAQVRCGTAWLCTPRCWALQPGPCSPCLLRTPMQ
jgi:hypothetical protein